MTPRVKKIKNDLIYFSARALMFLIQHLPYSWAGALGRSFGAAIFSAAGGERRKTLESIRTAYPDWNELKVFDLAQNVWKRLGQNLFEVVRWIPMTQEQVVAQVARVEGWENLEKALVRGKGTVVVTGHLGNWEMLGGYLGRRHPTTAVAKRLYDNRFDDLITWMRTEKLKVPMIKRGMALRGILEALKMNWVIYALVDQDTGKDGVFVPFFGKPAWTQSGIARVVRKTGAALVPAFMVRGGDGRFELKMDKEIQVPVTDDLEADVLETTRRYTEAVETAIRAYPDQWMWMHRRWKTRPADEIQPS
jgi:KDO2-lipid IV(A) lauroyltransferase